jgi:hypothetical protein
MNSSLKQNLGRIFSVCLLGMAMVGSSFAQADTTTSITDGEGTKNVKVESGEVVYVSGHDLVVKKDDGKIVHFANIPDSAKANIDGKEVGIHDLKPGMKLERTTITTVTPRTVMTVESLTGKVWHVNPPSSFILTLDNGKNEQFTLPDDAKITVNGQLTDAWGLKKGMIVSATRVTESPETVISQQTQVTGTPAPQAPAPNKPILFAMVMRPAIPAAAPAAPAPAVTPVELPATGSLLPLIGLMGLVVVGSSLALRVIRPTA